MSVLLCVSTHWFVRSPLPLSNWVDELGMEVSVLNNKECKELITKFIEEKPKLWDEDIGVPDS